jgi:16S rRNA processing protein RimM
MSERVVVGAIAGAYGVRGEVRLKSFCAVPEDIEAYSPLHDAEGQPYTVAVLRPGKNALIVRVAEIATKEAADALKGVELFADRDRMPSLPDDEFYHADLIDLSVFDSGGAARGRVKAVQNNGADDLLEIVVPGASQTVLLPFTKAAVPTVDLEIGRIIVDPPEGIFPDE